MLKENNFATSVGDEGGYAPNLESDESALELIVYAIGKAGYKPGKDIKIALDIASSEWYEDGVYTFPKKKIRKSGAEMIDYYTDLCARYPIVSIEDPFSEDDFGGFATFTKKLGKKTQVVGDDLFVTNTARLKLGINQKCGNAILIKPNQIGTLTETMQVVQLAKQFGYGTIISHRSGETEDTSIADIAVALNAGQIKTGAPARTDRVCKYNRLLRIERELGIAATYGPYTS